MLNLKSHPFAVEAFFESSLVLTFAVPKDKLQHFIPECVSLDTFNDQWAFVAVAMVRTKNLRPKGFPSFLGNDFFLIGFRIFVRYRNAAGRNLRGLYILHSETNKKGMNVLGNIFTQYHYRFTDISVLKTKDKLAIQSKGSGISIEVGLEQDAVLPVDSPFADWKQARRFAGPLPFTFTYNPKKKEVLIIEGVRQHWEPRPVTVRSHEIQFLKQLELDEMRLASAFLIENIPYHWKKGKIESWKP
jgi:hypothetical protein